MRSRIPQARGEGKRKAGRSPRSTIRESNKQSRLSSRENFQASFEAVGLECLFPFLVVVGVVRVEPIALGIHGEVSDLRQLRCLNQELLLGDEARDELDFVLVQVKLAAVEVAVHVGVRKKDFGSATFDDYVENVRALEFVEGLGREDHRGVVLAPGLEGFDDVPLNAWVLEEDPRFIYEEGFENG